MAEGKEEGQEIENLFEQIMKENFPNLMKGNRHTNPGSTRVLDEMDKKRTTPRHIIIKMPKVKYQEIILKATREKQRVTYKGVPIRLSADFSKETLQARGDGEKYSKS